MPLSSRVMKLLESDAVGLDTSNHVHFLEEAIQALRTSGDPLAAAQLLGSLWASPFAHRDAELAALDDVGSWLVGRIQREPTVAPPSLLLELGWLKRLARIRVRMVDEQARQAGRGRGGARPQNRFAAKLEALARARRAQAAPDQPRETAAPVPPAVLPEAFAVQFADLQVARKARQAMRDREKRGKAPKEALVALTPVDAGLRALAANLVCSTTRTAGFREVFERMDRNAGAVVPFYASAIERRSGEAPLARTLLQEPPG